MGQEGLGSVRGILFADKPKGLTSAAVARTISEKLGGEKVGHLGTLDPNATGVLPCLVGKATRLTPYLQEMDREYMIDILLGIRTDTDDIDGMILEEKDVKVSEEEIIKVLTSFRGNFKQVPPYFSAKRFKGKRLYELARRGEYVELPGIEVTIYDIEVLSIELPHVRIRVVSSPGMYARSLARDVGKKLGCGGTLFDLRRIRYGIYKGEAAVPFDFLKSASRDVLLKYINEITPHNVSMRGVIVRGENLRRVLCGNPPLIRVEGDDDEVILLCEEKGRAVAVGRIKGRVTKVERLLV